LRMSHSQERGPHRVSVALWGLRGPVAKARPFRVTVGVKCQGGCGLEGHLIEVVDEGGHCSGQAEVGPSPEVPTKGLYTTEMELMAPGKEGVYVWTVVCRGRKPPEGHEDAHLTFTFRVARVPEHTVEVAVRDEETGFPVVGADVFLGSFHVVTSHRGIGQLHVPADRYRLWVRSLGYEIPPCETEVDGEVTVELLARRMRERNPDETEEWM